MKIPAFQIGIILLVIGIASSILSYYSSNANDTLNGFLIGAGFGFLVWGWFVQKHTK